MKQVELDKLDRKILSVLQQDGRISNQLLAERQNKCSNIGRHERKVCHQ